MAFIEKAIELQNICIQGNIKRNPKDRKETAVRNFCQSCTICCITGRRFEGGCPQCPINGCHQQVVAVLNDIINENNETGGNGNV